MGESSPCTDDGGPLGSSPESGYVLDIREVLKGMAKGQATAVDPNESLPYKTYLPAPVAGQALDAALAIVWTLHCVRAGAASETSALGLSLPKIRAFGGWGLRSLVPERRYINPMCPASQSGHRFFGWMTASAALESSSH